MEKSQEKSSAAGLLLMFAVLVNAIILEQAFTVSSEWYNGMYISLPMFGFALMINNK
jgi:hypothetical protein